MGKAKKHTPEQTSPGETSKPGASTYRDTQRYQPTQRNDEDALTRAIIGQQYGRYGYRRITVNSPNCILLFKLSYTSPVNARFRCK